MPIIKNKTFTSQLTTPLVYGSSESNGDITIEGTSDSTKTTSYVILQPNSGNVGIGTTAPGSKLDIMGAVDGEFIGARIINSTQSTAGSTNETSALYLGWSDAVNFTAQAPKIVAGKLGDYSLFSTANSYLAFFTTLNNSVDEKVRIDNNGNVGIGTTTPTLAKLQVAGATLTQKLVEANTAGVGSPNIIILDKSGTIYTNEGTTALNHHTLPTAAAGLTFTFYVDDADGVHITANTGDFIQINGVVSSSAGYAEALLIGASVTLTAINDTDWVATSVVGSWNLA